MLSAHVIKQRRSFRVDVKFELAGGGTLAFFGSSGAGKSTVLHCLAGLDQPDTGYVHVDDAFWFNSASTQLPTPLHRRGIGLLTQQPNLFSHLRVGENVLFGVGREQGNDADQARWIEILRDRLQLAPLWNAPAASISGGQARRVALARMLARRPRLVLLDEPFTGLDRPLVRALIADLAEWRAALGFSLIAVDHQPEVLRQLCPERVIAIDAGRIVQEGRWEELYAKPATELLRSQLAPL